MGWNNLGTLFVNRIILPLVANLGSPGSISWSDGDLAPASIAETTNKLLELRAASTFPTNAPTLFLSENTSANGNGTIQMSVSSLPTEVLLKTNGFLGVQALIMETAAPGRNRFVVTDTVGIGAALAQLNQDMLSFSDGTGTEVSFLDRLRGLFTPVNVPVQLGSGSPGKNFAGHYTWSKNNVATNTLVAIANDVVVKEITDYATPMSAGVFTSPVDSFYDFFFEMDNAVGATREAAIIRRSGVEVAHEEAPNSTNVSACATNIWCPQGTVITFVPFFISATTPQNLTGTVTIGRRLT